jgi:hypothetical protein
MEWLLPGNAQYYSNGTAVTWGGHTYEAFRIKSFQSFTVGMIDSTSQEFPKIQVRLSNLANDSSSSFTIKQLDAAQVLEGAIVNFYIYSPDANDVGPIFWGHSGRPDYEGENKTVTLPVSFFWDDFNIEFPYKLLNEAGFNPTDASSQNSEDNQEDNVLPVVYGVSNFKVKPNIVRKQIDGSVLKINAVLSGVHGGAPFQSADVVASKVKLKSLKAATVVEFKTGGADSSAVPTNLTRFPDGLAHPNVAHFYAEFEIPSENKLTLDDIGPSDIKMEIANGRPLVDTGLPSENAPLIVKDVMRDPLYSIGLSNAIFDATALATAANYAGTRYQVRYEFHKGMPFTKRIQKMLGDFHGYVTFDNKLIQINCERNNETAYATFATSDSGHAGRKIHKDFIENVSQQKYGELLNKLTYKFRNKKHARRITTGIDAVAQARAAGTTQKVVDDEIDVWEDGGLWDETQVQIMIAIAIRKAQNANLRIRFKSPYWDSIDVSPGTIISVWSVDVFNNAVNLNYRVKTQDIDPEGLFNTLECEAYYQSIYSDSTAGIDIDLQRLSEDGAIQGRPPDVIPVSVALVDGGTNDTEGQQATLGCTCTIPAHDPSAALADSVLAEPPISAWQAWWNFTDESPNLARPGPITEVKQRATAFTSYAEIHVDYRKSKTVQVWFVALSPSRFRDKLGYIPDPLKVSTLTANINATFAIADVASVAPYNVNDYLVIEKELLRVFSKNPSSLSLYNDGVVRTAFFDTVSIAHPIGTEVSVAKLSYPSLNRSLLTPKFTYPVVTGLTARQKAEDIHFKWADVSAENRESYHFYYSVDADASTNVNKLGSATPAWYLADPTAPPAGVFLDLNDDLAHTIHMNEVGGAGIVVYARVAAKNGKRNFSSQLSVIKSNSASGGATPPTVSPSAPAPALLITNQPLVGSTGLAECVFRIQANGADNTKTFAQSNGDRVVLVLTDLRGKEIHPHYDVADTSATVVDFPLHLELAGLYVLTGVFLKNGAGKGPTATGSFSFGAGVTLAASNITGLSIASVTPIDAHHSYLNVQFTQPSSSSPTTGPVLLAYMQAFEKLAGEGSFSEEKKRQLSDDPTVIVAGLIPIRIKVKHPKNNAAQYQIKLVSKDGSSITSAVFSLTSPVEDTAAPNNGVALTIQRAKLRTKGGLVVDPIMPTAQMSTHSKTVLIIHDNNSLGTGRKFFDPYTATWVSTYPDGTTELTWGKAIPTVPIDKAAIFVGGRSFFCVRVGVYNEFNGGTATYSNDTATLITQAGSDPDPLAGDTNLPNNGALLPAPLVELNSKGATVEIPNFRSIAQLTTLTGATIRLQIQDVSGVGGCYWNGKRGSNLQTSLSPIDIDAGQTGTWTKNLHKPDVTRAFQNQFGGSAVPFYFNFYYSLSNSVGGVISASKSMVLSTDWLDVIGAREAVLTLDVQTSMGGSPHNLLPNSHFYAGNPVGAFVNLLDWARWRSSNPGTGPSSTLDTDTSNSLYYEPDNHQVVFRAIDRWLVTDNLDTAAGAVRGLEPLYSINDQFNAHFRAKSPNTTFTALVMRIGIYDALGNLLSTSPDIALNTGAGETVGAVSRLFRSTFQLTSLYGSGAADKNLYFVFRVISSTPAIDSAHLLAVDAFQMGRGLTPFPHTIRAKTENRHPFSPTPASVPQIDIGNSIGSRGGYGDLDTGGGFAL